MNQQTLQGDWNTISGKIRNKWGSLTDDDLQSAKGNVDQLVGMIQRKTGETRNAIESFLSQFSEQGAGLASQAAESVRQYAHQASEGLQTGSRKAMESMRYGYDEAEEIVRRHPTESAAVCFGMGVLVGVIVGASMRGR